MTIIVYHECTNATSTPSVLGDTINYTILSGTNITTLSSFTINQPNGLACFTYGLYMYSNTSTVASLPSYITYSYPNITIGPTAAL